MLDATPKPIVTYNVSDGAVQPPTDLDELMSTDEALVVDAPRETTHIYDEPPPATAAMHNDELPF